jgi:hypothetical protein
MIYNKTLRGIKNLANPAVFRIASVGPLRVKRVRATCEASRLKLNRRAGVDGEAAFSRREKGRFQAAQVS